MPIRARVILPILVFVAAWLNWGSPLLRFASPLANRAAFLVAMLLPLVALSVGSSTASPWQRWLLRLPVVPFVFVGLLMSVPTALGIYDTARDGTDPSFETIARYEVAPLRLTVYRTHCGPMCSNGVVIRAERQLVPGLLFVRDVFRDTPADSAVVRALPGQRIEVAVPSRNGMPDGMGKRDTIPLPWPWSPPQRRDSRASGSGGER